MNVLLAIVSIQNQIQWLEHYIPNFPKEFMHFSCTQGSLVFTKPLLIAVCFHISYLCRKAKFNLLHITYIICYLIL